MMARLPRIVAVVCNLSWIVLFLGDQEVFVSATPEQSQQQQQQQQQLRQLQSVPVDITDATANFFASTESTFDHEVALEDNLSFHWNDIQGDSFMGRLIHKSDSMDQAPSWIAFGVYHSNHNYTDLPTSNFMIGSTAVIGSPSQAEASAPAQHYHLGAKMVDAIQPVDDDGSFQNAIVVQHDSDDGKVITDLSFTKSLTGPEQSSLRREGVNVFLWAIGPPGGTPGRLGKHSQKGVLLLDLQAVQQEIEGTSGGGGSAVGGGDGDGDGTTNMDSSIVNTSPVIRGQCGSSLLEGGGDEGQVALTPTLIFHWKLLGTRIQIALEFTGREAWLGVAASSNGYMIGSSAVIGIPGNDSLARPPLHYTLNDQDISGVVEDGAVVLEDATIVSTPAADDPSTFTTVLKYTKLINDPNDPVPIVGGGSLTTFLYAVGASRELGYHEHRGAFRLNLEECGGTVASESDSAVWTNHGTFAAHGFFAVLAWGLLSPFAITVAWFRTLVPASWIYIHVMANASSFLLTVAAFIAAIVGISKEDEADHFSKTHHWVGMILTFLATFQVINGFLRPPVVRKDARTASSPDTFLGVIPVPRTPRETWHLMHRVAGLAAIAMGIYQIQSGLGLYSQRFQANSMVKYYWIYVALFFMSLIGLKLWVVYEEDKARQGVLQAVNTAEPSASEEEPTAPQTVGSSFS